MHQVRYRCIHVHITTIAKHIASTSLNKKNVNSLIYIG